MERLPSIPQPVVEGLAQVLGLSDANPDVVRATGALLLAMSGGFDLAAFERQVDDARAQLVVMTAEAIAQVAAEHSA